jgi:hypothetical protein
MITKADTEADASDGKTDSGLARARARAEGTIRSRSQKRRSAILDGGTWCSSINCGELASKWNRFGIAVGEQPTNQRGGRGFNSLGRGGAITALGLTPRNFFSFQNF